MGCNRDRRSEKTRGMTLQRPSRSRLSHKQKMERPYSEGKQHQPQNSRTCSVRNKVLKTKDSASICTNNSVLEEDINNFYNDVDETLRKPNHHTILMGEFDAQIGERKNHMEMASSIFGLELRHDRGDTLIESATSRKYKTMRSEERRKEMEVEKPKRCNEDRN